MCHNVDTDEKKMGPSLKGLFKHKTLKSGKPVNDANVLRRSTTAGTECRLTAICFRRTRRRTCSPTFTRSSLDAVRTVPKRPVC